jgi:hypothetical protein
MRPIPSMRCLACGGPIEDTLFRLGSPRCLDCRQEQRPLDPVLAGTPSENGSVNGSMSGSVNGSGNGVDNGRRPVSVTVRVSDASLTLELLDFLRRRACEAELIRGDLLLVRPHPTLRAAHVRAELEVLIAAWQRERPDVRATLVA